jgi:hypothetical protein
MSTEGLEPPSPSASHDRELGEETRGALQKAVQFSADPDLLQVLMAWPRLSAETRAAVLAMVRSASSP